MIETQLPKKDIEEIIKSSKNTSGQVFINVSGSDLSDLQRALGPSLRKNKSSVVILLKDQ